MPVIRILNPFNPREFVRETIVWSPTKPLSQYFPVGTASAVVSVNGKIIDPDRFAVTYLDRTDNLVICPIPQGGGNGKTILTLVAMIAITVATAGWGAAAAGAMDMTGTTAAVVGGMIQAGITMAGSLLVHAIFAPSRPTSAASANTSSYGIDGAKNTSVEGIPVPVCYGEFRQAGNVLGMYVESDGDTQNLYMLLSAGEGEIAGISDIEINDNPITDYDSKEATVSGIASTASTIETQIRLGLHNQLPVPWFEDTVVSHSIGKKTSNLNWITYTTAAQVDKIRVDVYAPGGLFKVNTKTGALDTAAVDLIIQYSKIGTDTWASLSASEIVSWRNVTGQIVVPLGGYIDANGNVFSVNLDNATQITPTWNWAYEGGGTVTSADSLEYLRSNPPPAASGQVTSRVPLYSGALRLEDNKRSAVRRSFSSPVLTSSKYTIRIKRTTADSSGAGGDPAITDQVFVSDINEIQLEKLSYPNTALLGLKITLSDLITGLPKVTFLNHGRKVKVWGRVRPSSTAPDQWYDSASTNPAWIVWDMLTNQRFGGSMPTARLDLAAFKVWAAYCVQADLTWNGILDAEMNVWDACQLVLRVGHAQLVSVGTRYTIVIERAAAPVMMFSVANMIENSYKEVWLPTADRANEIDVTYFDKEDKYKQRTVKVYDPAVLSSGQKQRTSAITLYGVVDSDTAYKEGQFQLNLNRHILKTVTFSAPMEAIACSVGDLIYVQHDMTEWAVAGRFDEGSTTFSIYLDREVTMLAGKQYKLLAVRDKVQRAIGTVSLIVGNTVYLNGFNGTIDNIRRIIVNGVDRAVLEGVRGTGSGSSGSGVVVDDATGMTGSGASYTLWDTDVIEEFNVISSNHADITTTNLYLQAPMTVAPLQFANWMFGESDKVKKPFRIKSIAGGHDYRRDITAIEYNAAVYDYSRYGGDAPYVPLEDAAIGPVRSLEVYEETYISGASATTKIVASWRAPQVGNYAGADVYVQKNKAPIVKAGTAASTTWMSLDSVSAIKGDKLLVKVVAYDVFGKRAPYDLAPQKLYEFVGTPAVPIVVGEVTGANFIWAGRECKVSWRYNSITRSFEFGTETNGAGAGALDPQFKDYEVNVYGGQGRVLRRTEYVKDSSYVYTYDKNFSDHKDKTVAPHATRSLIFEIAQRDVYNNKSSPATIVAHNPSGGVSDITASTTFNSATISYKHSADSDFASVRVWMAESSASISGSVENGRIDGFTVYDGPNSVALLTGLMFDREYFYRLAAIDAFGATEIAPSPVLSFKTTFLDVDAIKPGSIAADLLGIDLMSRIGLIDGPSTMIGSLAHGLLEQAKNGTLALNEAKALLESRGQALSDRVDSAINDYDRKIVAEAKLRSDAILKEMQDRTKSVLDEASLRSKGILDEATARGTAVTNANAAMQTATGALAVRIDSLTAVTGSNTAAITDERSARTSADNALAQSTTALTVRVGSSETAILNETHARSDAITSVLGITTTLTARVGDNAAAIVNETNARVAADGSTVTRLDSISTKTDTNTAAISTETTARATAVSAVSQRLDSVSAKTDTNSTAITTEQNARILTDGTLAQSITTLSVRTTNAEGVISSNQQISTTKIDNLTLKVDTANSAFAGNIASIISAQSALTAADTAASTRIDSILSTVVGHTSQISTTQQTVINLTESTAHSLNSLKVSTDSNTLAITDERTARTTKELATAQTIGALEVKVNTNTAKIVDVNTAIANEKSATAEKLSAIWVETRGNKSSIDSKLITIANDIGTSSSRIDSLTSATGTSLAGIQSDLRTYTDSLEAQAMDIELLAVGFDENTASIGSVATAAANANQTTANLLTAVQSDFNLNKSIVSGAITTLTTNTEAQARDITLVTATVGGHTSAIQTQALAIAGVGAQYTIKLDYNGKVAGFGLINGVQGSAFAVAADSFAVYIPGYSEISPFSVGLVNGAAKVVIDSAVIADASITTAKIADASITTAKIGNMIVNSANIADGAITTAKIGSLTVTNAHIANLTVGTHKITGSAVSDTVWLGGGGTSTGMYSSDGGTIIAFMNVFHPAWRDGYDSANNPAFTSTEVATGQVGPGGYFGASITSDHGSYISSAVIMNLKK